MSARVDELLRAARRRLAAAPFAPSTREAGLLLSRLLGWSEARLLAYGEAVPPEAVAARFEELLERRLAGEPIAYLLGEREFYGRSFRVDPRVLIPRPETEHLVEAALALSLPASPRLLDLGTGSGCLAVTLALEIPAARAIAADVELGAVALALGNARRLGAGERVHGLCIDLTQGLRLDVFDLVVSNPPYVAEGDLALSPEVADHEPARALFADDEGLGVIDRIFTAASTEPRGLRRGAALLIEIGAGQLARVRRAAARRGLEVERVIDDYAGIPRTLVIRRQR